MEGLRLGCIGPHLGLRPVGRNCPDLYGGIATSPPGLCSPILESNVGTALICMEGLRLLREVDRGGRRVIGVGTALICMEGLRHVRLQPNLEEEEDELGKLVKLEEDSVRLYHFCLECDEKQEIYGQGKLTEEPDVYIL